MATGTRRISDPVHGVIELSELEVNIINTKSFQRLRGVKQLGLAHYVFPGADYSRFSHSLGACHVMGRILTGLNTHGAASLSPEAIAMYRAAALLHDVGHYPFSHATEYALENYYATNVVEPVPGEAAADVDEEYADHETVTGLVINEDPEISTILENGGVKPKDVEDTVRRQAAHPPLANLISSDLDADRIDYLLRTAHHAGLPYGSVDIDYLLTQMRLDGQRRVCLTPKAARAAEHMLLCRYFDYQQVVFHKAVAGFEWVLKECIADLVRNKRLTAAKAEIRAKIANGKWANFDDPFLIALFRRAREHARTTEIEHLRLECLLERKPPVMLAQDDEILTRPELLKQDRMKVYRSTLQACAAQFEIPPERLHVWNPPPMTLTKIGGKVDVSAITEDDPKKRDKLEQAVRIQDGETSVELQSMSRSLMRVLSEHGVRPMRLFALLKESERPMIDDLKAFAREKLAH